MLARLAHVIARRRKVVIGVWLVLTLFGGFSASQVSKRWFQSFSIPGYSAYEANVRTMHVFGTGMRPPNVVVFHTSGDATKSAPIRAAMARAAKSNPGARDELVLLDGQPCVRLAGQAHDLHGDLSAGHGGLRDEERREKRRARLRQRACRAASRVHVTGHDPLEEAAERRARRSGRAARSDDRRPRRDRDPPLRLRDAARGPDADRRRIAAILNTFTLVWALTYITDVSIIVQFLIALVGLGVAIDYALLMIFRFRDELREGYDVETALVETMTHAGRCVIVSGSTVAVGLLSLIILPLPFIRSIGIGGMLIPAVSVLAAITLLPALLATLGERINSVRVLPKRWVDHGHPEDGPWGRWARFVNRRPWPVAIVGLVIVAVLATIGTQLNPNEAQMKSFPGTGDAIVGRDALTAAGITPGVLKPFDVLVENGAESGADRGQAPAGRRHRRRFRPQGLVA